MGLNNVLKYSALVLCLSTAAYADTANDINELAHANGFSPSARIVNAIVEASEMYNVDALELTSIGIIESGLGKYAHERHNTNGSVDKGVFQINTVNHSKCVGLDLNTPEGSAMCAAKILSQIKAKHADYVGRYHSKTPSLKTAYIEKVTQVMSLAALSH